MRAFILAVAVVALAGGAVGASGSASIGPSRSGQGEWVATVLEHGSDFWGTSAVAVNERGQIVGDGLVGDLPPRGFLWEKGTLTNLGVLAAVGEEPRTSPKDINDRGQVVGESTSKTGQAHAFLWQQGKLRDLGTLPGKLRSIAVAINARGQVIGNSYDAWVYDRGGEVAPRAFIWQGGKMTDLGSLGGRSSSAAAINDKGQVVGWSQRKSGVRHAFLWQNGRMRDLGTLAGKKWSTAVAINAHGQIIGNSYTRHSRPNGITGLDLTKGEFGSRAFLWEKGRMVALRTPNPISAAVAINDHGLVVGHTVITTRTGAVRYQEMHAFLWRAGRASYLSTPSGNSFSDALAINNRGQVVGIGGVVGAYNAYLWDGGKRTLLPNPGGFGHDDEVTASAITNGGGQIIGTRTATMDSARAVLWTRP